MSCLIERTETPPFFRVTSLRKTSSHWGESGTEPTAPSGSGGGQINRPEDVALGNGGLSVEKGTIHTKRHSSEDPAMLTLSAAAVVAVVVLALIFLDAPVEAVRHRFLNCHKLAK